MKGPQEGRRDAAATAAAAAAAAADIDTRSGVRNGSHRVVAVT